MLSERTSHHQINILFVHPSHSKSKPIKATESLRSTVYIYETIPQCSEKPSSPSFFMHSAEYSQRCSRYPFTPYQDHDYYFQHEGEICARQTSRQSETRCLVSVRVSGNSTALH